MSVIELIFGAIALLVIYMFFKNQTPTTPHAIATEAEIIAAYKDGNYNAFIVKSSKTKNQITKALKSKDNLSDVVSLIEKRISNDDYEDIMRDDPIRYEMEQIGKKFIPNKNATRVMVSSDNHQIFNWDPPES